MKTPFVSTQGLAVLRALAARPRYWYQPQYGGRWVARPAGSLRVRDLVQKRRRRGVAKTVARASLSRTLRRLWREGLVELSDGLRTLTQARQRAREQVAALDADPDAAYERHLDFCREYEMADVHGSAAAYVAWRRQRAEHPDLRVTIVEITAIGRMRLTSPDAEQLTETPSPTVNNGVRAELTETERSAQDLRRCE